MGSEASKDAGNKPWDLPQSISSIHKDFFETSESSGRLDPRAVENAFSEHLLDEARISDQKNLPEKNLPFSSSAVVQSPSRER